MKKLELSNYGIVEMNQTEMIGVDGGLTWQEIGAAIMALGIAIYVAIVL